MDINYIERWLPEATVNYKDGGPAVGLGLIITVFFRDGHLPEVRRKMVECVDRFYAEFGTHLKKQMTERWSGITEKNYAKNRQEIIDSTPEDVTGGKVMYNLLSYLPKYTTSANVTRKNSPTGNIPLPGKKYSISNANIIVRTVGT